MAKNFNQLREKMTDEQKAKSAQIYQKMLSDLEITPMKILKLMSVMALAMSLLTACTSSPTSSSKPIDSDMISIKQAVAELNHSVQRTMTAEQVQDCKMLGGKVTKVGMAQFDFCSITFSDSGKACQDGSQCQSGSCLAPRHGVIKGQTNQSGMCSQDNSKFGCRQTISNGVAGARLCLD